MNNPLLSVSHLGKEYHHGGQKIIGIKDISFSLQKRECFGIVGESGSGKSTLGRLIAGLDTPTQGKVDLKGHQVQMIFQNPFSAVNPRMKLSEILLEPLVIQHVGTKQERLSKVREILSQIGLPQFLLDRYPSELSGGQLQRAVIGRSLLFSPQLLVADEPTASLDVSIQAQMMELLLNMRERTGMALVLISHDLNLVRRLCPRLAVLEQGELAELGETRKIWENPQSDAAKKLISGCFHF